jgi:hypothetical protein
MSSCAVFFTRHQGSWPDQGYQGYATKCNSGIKEGSSVQGYYCCNGVMNGAAGRQPDRHRDVDGP